MSKGKIVSEFKYNNVINGLERLIREFKQKHKPTTQDFIDFKEYLMGFGYTLEKEFGINFDKHNFFGSTEQCIIHAQSMLGQLIVERAKVYGNNIAQQVNNNNNNLKEQVLERENADLKNQIQILKKQLADSNLEKLKNEVSAEDYKKKCKDLQKKLNKSEASKEKLQKKLNEKSGDFEEALKKITERKEKYKQKTEELKKELENTKASKSEDYKNGLESLKKELEELKASKAKYKNKYKANKKELDLKNKIESKTLELKELELNELRDTNDSQKEKINELNTKIDNLSQSNTKMFESLQTIKEKALSLVPSKSNSNDVESQLNNVKMGFFDRLKIAFNSKAMQQKLMELLQDVIKITSANSEFDNINVKLQGIFEDVEVSNSNNNDNKD